MKKILTLVNDNLYISALLKAYGFIVIVWGLLSYVDLMPFYQIKLYKVNSVTPTISLFPGQKIRLDFDFHDALAQQDVASAIWYLVKDGKKLYGVNGLRPTITLPPAEGGIYQLEVFARMDDDKTKSGKINLYVVQDKPEQITVPQAVQLTATIDNNSPEFLKKIQMSGAEVYSGEGKWTKVQTISTSGNKAVIEVKPNEHISSFNNQLLIRAQDSFNDLNSYGSVEVPRMQFESLQKH